MKSACVRALKQTHEGLRSLKGSPRDLYIVYAINACDNFNYFSLSLLFTLYLTEEFGFTDQQTGVLYGLWGCAITLFGFAFGGIVDFLGVKKTLAVAFVLTGTGRLLLAVSHTKWMLLTAIFGPVSFGLAFGSPAVLIAVKRYTKESNRGFAYAVLYAAMNVASLLSGWALDLFRITLRDGFGIRDRPADSVLNSGYRLYLVLGCFAAGTGFLLNFTIREHSLPAKHSRSRASSGVGLPLAPDQHRLTDDGEGVKPVPQDVTTAKSRGKNYEAATSSEQGREEAEQQSGPAQPNALQRVAAQVKELVSSREFRKYMAMCVITVNLKAIFRHLDATLPKYQVRSFGCSAPVGTVYSINPAMIMTLVPLVGAAATHYSHFDMIHYGSYVSALSPLWMAVFTTEWATVLFVIQLSFGESIWSPRWYDYSMSVAPEGREGVFTAMASAPLFLGKFVTGTASGYLLGQFCPNDGVNCGEADPGRQTPGYQCHGHTLWLIITLLTCMSPFGILIFQKWLRPAPKSAQPVIVDEEAQQLSRNTSIDIPVPLSRRQSHDRLTSSVVLQEAGVGWEETTQLLQGQIARFVSRDDSDRSLHEDAQPHSEPLSRSVSI